MPRRTSLKTLLVGAGIGAGLMVILFFTLNAMASPTADDVNANAIYFTWWYVLGTLIAFFQKIIEGVIKHVPARRFSWKKLVKIFLLSSPFLVVCVFFFLPKYGPPTGVWQKDTLYAFLTAYATLGIGSSLEDFRRYIDFIMGDDNPDLVKETDEEDDQGPDQE